MTGDGWETEAQRIKKRLRAELTPRQRLANWWHYHKLHVAAGVIAALALSYVLLDSRRPEPDYTIGWVSALRLDEEGAAETVRRLSRYAADLNGDGHVEIAVHQIILDLDRLLAQGAGTGGQQELGELMALEADLDVGQSGIFLTDSPAAFQAYTGALVYRDGTYPAEGASDWENMVVPWEQAGTGTVYAGLRGCWKEDWAETWNQYLALWRRLEAAAR